MAEFDVSLCWRLAGGACDNCPANGGVVCCAPLLRVSHAIFTVIMQEHYNTLCVSVCTVVGVYRSEASANEVMLQGRVTSLDLSPGKSTVRCV